MCSFRPTVRHWRCGAPTAGSRSTAAAATHLPSRNGSPAADGNARLPNDKNLGQGFRCDTAGCIATLTDGKLVSQVIAPDAFEEDCRRAAVVVTNRNLPGECKALAIDRRVSRSNGALALRRSGESFEINTARPSGQDRPWARATAIPEETTAPAVTRPQPRDATPRTEDLEAGD
jgi:competence protein ComEC